MRRVGVALAAVVVFSGLGAGSAAATITLELSRDRTKLLPGEEFRSFISLGGGENVPHEGATTIETNPGQVVCPGGATSSGLIGKVQTNGKVTDKIKMESAFGTLNAEEFEHDSPYCSNTTSLGTSALVHLRPRGGFLELNGEKASAKLKEVSKTEPLLLEIAYSGGTTCTYTAVTVKGTLTLEASFEPYQAEGRRQINVEFAKQKVTLMSGSAAQCPTKVTVTAPFGVQSHKASGGGEEYVWGRLV